jgi:transcription antitermination factor NusG
MPTVEEISESRLSGDVDPWYAIYTRHQHEKSVARILSDKGHETFLPLYRVAHRWKDRTQLVHLPLFPCYVFFRGGVAQQQQVLRVPGVFSIVTASGRPAKIPANEIEGVRQLIQSPLQIEPHPFLQCGDRVIVTSGPLEGLEGILVRKKNAFRLVISVEMLGRSAAVEIDAVNLQRIAPNQSPFGVGKPAASAFASL